MIIVTSLRGGGKTHRLIEEALEHENAIVLTQHVLAAQYAKQMCVKILTERGVSKLTAEGRAERMITSNISKVRNRKGPLYIDNIDQFLERYLGKMPAAISCEALVETPQGKRFDTLQGNPHLSEALRRGARGGASLDDARFDERSLE